MRMLTYTPPRWRVAALGVFTAMMCLGDVWLVAWWIGSVRAAAIAAGAIAGLTLAIGWTIRHYRADASVALLVTTIATLGVLARGVPGAGLPGTAVALGVFAVWFLFYDVWFTGRANAEVVSPVTPLGGDGRTGRALIVYHQGRGPAYFQARMQRAFAEGLQAQRWQVDLTTASRKTPTDLSRYDLLVLGAQAYNWSPARSVTDYVDRIAPLRGKPVVLIVSGGGMTERALHVLRAHVVNSGGVIADAIEIWTTRSNQERYGLTDPAAIMQRAGSRLTLVPERRTA